MNNVEGLRTLLRQINLNDNYTKYFENGYLEKVEIDRDKKSWSFFVHINEVLPFEVYQIFDSLINSTFDKIDSVEQIYFYINTNVTNYNKDIVLQYWNLCVKTLESHSPMFQILNDRDIFYENNTLIIESFNSMESNRLAKYIDKVKQIYNSIGINDIDIKVTVNENSSRKKSLLEEQQAILEKERVKAINTKPVVQEEKPKRKGRKKVNINVDDLIIYGREIKGHTVDMSSIKEEMNNVNVEGYLFDSEPFETRAGRVILTLKLTDYSDSIFAKMFLDNSDMFDELKPRINSGSWIKVNGNVRYDEYANDYVLMIQSINSLEKPKRKDTSEIKRVELHAHTTMSQLDGVVSPSDLIKQAADWGHSAIAITDHVSAQAFPDAFGASKKHGIKVIYGVEVNVVDDSVGIVKNGTDTNLKGETYVVFDFETTGFNAASGDQIIEFGAVKIKDGNVIDKFEALVDPKRKLSAKIIEVTGITDDMLVGQPSEREVVIEFKEWIKDHVIVAHNAAFDISFLSMAYKKYDLGTVDNPVIDTLELSRALHPEWGRHGLAYLTKRYNIELTNHHRAVYDAEATAYVLNNQIEELLKKDFIKLNEINNIVKKEDIHKQGKVSHAILLAKNNDGLKNMFKLISKANTEYFHKIPRILKSEIESLREGILVGSACSNGEIFEIARKKQDNEIIRAMEFYDYIEVQPIEIYDHMLQSDEFASRQVLINHIEKIVRLGEMSGKIVVATGDVHHINPEDKVYREVYINTPSPGGGRHPLDKRSIYNVPSFHFRSTDEMMQSFSFLGEDKAYEIIVTNTNKIADMINEVEVIKDKLFTPKIDGVDEKMKEMCYEKARSIYGENLPQIVIDRLDKELNSIITHGFSVVYYISHQLVKKSLDDGYLVGSRGSVGSSLVATFMDITEVNPLPPHYVCPSCMESIFETEEGVLGSIYGSGYDLPEMNCPNCNTKMNRDGHDIPFETFLGFKGDKVPDIDLNFSGEYQANAHNYTKVLFGEDNVFRAGTIGTVAEKTAFGFVKGYQSDKDIDMRSAEIERLVRGCAGVKRTTGQHPGGIIVIPDYMDVYDFTPIQFPADDVNSEWKTTHFDFHAIHDNVLKLDILGHDDPTMIRMLEDLTGIDAQDVPTSDVNVLSLYSDASSLGVESELLEYNVKSRTGEIERKEYELFSTGTLAVPEFGTRFVISMLEDTKPKSFAELVKISGLSHGTDVWLNNAEMFLKEGKCDFKDVIGCRDDIMVYLMYQGLEPQLSFTIMESVRKGKGLKDEWITEMKKNNVPEWYIESCRRIKYMFPKAHATAYVLMAVRIAWFKVHYPIQFYSAYFSVRASDFDIDTMIKGPTTIKARIEEILSLGFGASNKEKNVLGVLEIAYEMTKRGLKFGNIDLYKSDAVNFIIDGNTLIPPFRSLDGLGMNVALKIVEEREKAYFLSKEDLQKRGKVSKTLIDKMDYMGVISDLPDTNQLDIFQMI